MVKEARNKEEQKGKSTEGPAFQPRRNAEAEMPDSESMSQIACVKVRATLHCR